MRLVAGGVAVLAAVYTTLVAIVVRGGRLGSRRQPTAVERLPRELV
jgi:hypothetical protein